MSKTEEVTDDVPEKHRKYALFHTQEKERQMGRHIITGINKVTKWIKTVVTIMHHLAWRCQTPDASFETRGVSHFIGSQASDVCWHLLFQPLTATLREGQIWFPWCVHSPTSKEKKKILTNTPGIRILCRNWQFPCRKNGLKLTRKLPWMLVTLDYCLNMWQFTEPYPGFTKPRN